MSRLSLQRKALPVIAPGLWRMRNGEIAKINGALEIPYIKDGVQKIFRVWTGHCVECSTPMTWNLNGTYGVVALDAFDLVGAP